MNTATSTTLLKIIAALWVIWGLVHVLAGVIILSSDAPDAVAAVADAVDPVAVAGPYHEAAGALINQHGFNLFWIGWVTTISAYFIWRANYFAVFLAGLVGGLADVGYFLFMDLGGYVNFVPGTIMTIVSASAIILSLVAWNAVRQTAAKS